MNPPSYEESLYSFGAEMTSVVSTLTWVLGTEAVLSACAIGICTLNHKTKSPVGETFSFSKHQCLFHVACIKHIQNYFKYV